VLALLSSWITVAHGAQNQKEIGMLSRTRTAPRARAPRPSARLVPSVVVSMVLLSSGSFVIFPLIPALQSTLGVSTAEIGYLAAAGFGAALIAELLVAPAADRGHARLMAVGGVLLVAASLALSAAAGAGWQLIAARGLGGFGGGRGVIGRFGGYGAVGRSRVSRSRCRIGGLFRRRGRPARPGGLPAQSATPS